MLFLVFEALQLPRPEQSKWLGAVGYAKGFETDGQNDDADNDWKKGIKQFTEQVNLFVRAPSERAMLLADLHKLLARHRAGPRQVTKAIVPVADWNAQLFSLSDLHKMTEAIIQEAKFADIMNFGMVVPSGLPDSFISDLSRSFPDAQFHRLVQDPSKLGLGAAILAGEDFLDGEAFALLLPDIQAHPLDRPRILSRLHDLYKGYSRSILAVRRASQVRYIRKRAVVTLKPNLDSSEEVRPVETVEYRAVAPDEYYVLGRCILTDAIFDAVRSVLPDEWGFVRLGSVLKTLLERELIYAADFGTTNIYSFSIPQELLHEIVDNLTGNLANLTVTAALDELAIQLDPWSNDVTTFEKLLDMLVFEPKVSDEKWLSQLLVKLALLRNGLEREEFPFIYWAQCFDQIIRAINLVVPKTEAFRLFTRDSKEAIKKIVSSLKCGHKTEVSQELWLWATTVKVHQAGGFDNLIGFGGGM